MAITLTQTAAERVQKFLSNRGKGVGLRLGVKTTGCSGMAYVLEFVDSVEADDQVFESFGVQVIVNVQARLTRRDTGAVLSDQPSIEARERYEVSIDQVAYFDESAAAIDRLSRDVARSVVSAILENF